MRCPVLYSGPTYPLFHGVQCELEAPHDGQRHLAHPTAGGHPLSWWEPEEKEVVRARRRRWLS